MTETAVVDALAAALALGDTLVIVRGGGAIAEVAGGPLRLGEEWLTLGAEEPGASHVHVRRADVVGVRYREADGRNAALEALDATGAVVLTVSVRRTNPGRPATFDPARLAVARARIGHLGGEDAA